MSPWSRIPSSTRSARLRRHSANRLAGSPTGSDGRPTRCWSCGAAAIDRALGLGFAQLARAFPRATRRSRPLLARQSHRWGAYGALGWVVACRASRDINGLKLRVLLCLGWWLVVWQMLAWHLGMTEGGDGQPRARLSRADAVSLARFWLVPSVPTLARSSTGLPVVIVIAGATDWLDGALARRDGRTRLGRDLDTTADLAFLTTAAVSARACGRITPLSFRALAARYAIGVALSLAAVFGRARRPAIRARPWGALPRTAGLAMGTAGLRRTGTAVLLCGCLVPPKPTAGHLSPT